MYRALTYTSVWDREFVSCCSDQIEFISECYKDNLIRTKGQWDLDLSMSIVILPFQSSTLTLVIFFFCNVAHEFINKSSLLYFSYTCIGRLYAVLLLCSPAILSLMNLYTAFCWWRSRFQLNSFKKVRTFYLINE